MFSMTIFMSTAHSTCAMRVMNKEEGMMIRTEGDTYTHICTSDCHS